MSWKDLIEKVPNIFVKEAVGSLFSSLPEITVNVYPFEDLFPGS